VDSRDSDDSGSGNKRGSGDVECGSGDKRGSGDVEW
jgi:hypothetical protein